MKVFFVCLLLAFAIQASVGETSFSEEVAPTEELLQSGAKTTVAAERRHRFFADGWLSAQRAKTGHRFGDHKYKAAAVAFKKAMAQKARHPKSALRLLRKASANWNVARHRYTGKKGGRTGGCRNVRRCTMRRCTAKQYFERRIKWMKNKKARRARYLRRVRSLERRNKHRAALRRKAAARHHERRVKRAKAIREAKAKAGAKARRAFMELSAKRRARAAKRRAFLAKRRLERRAKHIKRVNERKSKHRKRVERRIKRLRKIRQQRAKALKMAERRRKAYVARVRRHERARKVRVARERRAKYAARQRRFERAKKARKARALRYERARKARINAMEKKIKSDGAKATRAYGNLRKRLHHLQINYNRARKERQVKARKPICRRQTRCWRQCKKSCHRKHISWNDQMSSALVSQKRCSITVYKHCNYRGKAVTLYPGSYNLHNLRRRGFKNDDISSVRVNGNCHAYLYEHDHFRGKRLFKNRNDPCFTNDRMRLMSLELLESPKKFSHVEVMTQAQADAKAKAAAKAKAKRTWHTTHHRTVHSYKTVHRWHHRTVHRWHHRTVHRWHHRTHWRTSGLSCRTNTAASNHAGIVRAGLSGGYQMVGGGIYNHYRHFNRLSAFEESMPEGNNWRCDTGFGPGRVTCYNRQCRLPGMHCTTRSVHKNGHGVAIARLPGGYVATGGGVYNHYRHFNKHSAFETSIPHGNNGWHCDMGLGYGRFNCYVRGCRNTHHKQLHCLTRRSGAGNWHNLQCPRGYTLTGCGQNELRRQWNHLSGFEEFRVHGNGCVCDSGFGGGNNHCYARCCQMRTKSVHRYRRAHRIRYRRAHRIRYRRAHRVRVSRRVRYTRRHSDNTFNDEVSSVQARQPSCRVTLYKHCNYRGRSVSLTPGRYNMHALIRKGMRNDDISSVRVSKGCVAHLYQHWRFNGARLTKTGNDSCFTNDVMFRRTICRNQCKRQCRSHRVCHRRRVSYRGLSHYHRAMNNTRRHMHAAARRMHAARRAAAAHARRHGKKGKKCSGRSWCETFYVCKKGDRRNFHAFVKSQGYRMHKGACAHGNGRYGRRHRFWGGKFTFAQCRAKCDRMGRSCEGITMTTAVRRRL